MTPQGGGMGIIMIYSEDINKVCALCTHATAIPENEEEMYCCIYKKNTAVTQGGCKKFKYDIFKKTIHRKRRLRTEFDAEDFKL